MSSFVFLFPGQGSQHPGMGQQLIEICPQAKTIFACGEKILGIDLQQVCLNSTAIQLAQTHLAQPALFSISLIAANVLKQYGITPAATAGHSLGEYAAMVCAGMISMEDGYRLILHRTKVMAACAKQHPGGMCAVLGVTPDQVEQWCEEIPGYIVPVNYNAPTQTVVAGDPTALASFCHLLKQQKVKYVSLAVNAAFHSKLMQPAADAFLKEILSIPFHDAKIDFYSNMTANQLDAETIVQIGGMPHYLAQHLVSPVRFTDQIQSMVQAGYHHYVELGSGNVLSGLLKKMRKNITISTVHDLSSLESFLKQIHHAPSIAHVSASLSKTSQDDL